MSRRRLAPIALLAVLALGSACARTPVVAEPLQVAASARVPRAPRAGLAAKADAIAADASEMVNEAGLLLYRARFPWGDSGRALENYRRSHALADAPAWHGYFMAALAFEAATREREPERDAGRLAAIDAELRRLAGAYERFYAMSGERGLIGNSMLPGYDGAEPLAWMAHEGDEDHKPWVRSESTGEWWRDGTNKGHLSLAVFGCAIPLALDRDGSITLTEETRSALVAVMVPMVRRLVEGGYLIRDRNGQPTQHGDLGPRAALVLPNGFNRTLVLHMLASAAPYDDDLAEEYERRLHDWSGGIASSLEASGTWARNRGHWNRQANVGHSDPQALALAATSFLLQEERPPYRDRVLAGLAGWWRFMRYELNGPYTLAVAAFLARDAERASELAGDIIAELHDLPAVKTLGGSEPIETPGVVQPIRNRPIDTNYWKSSPYERADATANTRAGAWRAPGVDFLIAYWMGRYFDLIPPDAEARMTTE